MTTEELLPTAEYAAPHLKKQFMIDPTQKHSTQGKTTGPSDHVLNAGAVDEDMPSVASDTQMGRLREYLTTLQDDVNTFLTERMHNDGSSNDKDNDIERRVLDEGVDEDDEE
ncbi:unnamed protein product [Ambrosiozyma monospora]|uniref:EKC/KEOPS complex subunit GON7 n=1 Tax=Ambrosiozyma monospora TaxID=43982 RepID=A0A9W6YWI1_AMBMO|nr:unnamed protein product [Ambrosiozyma monospora]